jgi:hypothetical protein
LAKGDDTSRGIVQSISDNLGAFFRHLFPGIVILGAAYIAHPRWFTGLDTRSWQHILIVAVVSLAAGNLWFAINRYGIHQFVDYLLYLAGSEGPAPAGSRTKYLEDVGKYAAESLCKSDVPQRARQHVAFRASSILLLYTVAEVGFLVSIWHDPDTFFAKHTCPTVISSLLIFAAALWQNVIARRVDYYVINFEPKKRSHPTLI